MTRYYLEPNSAELNGYIFNNTHEWSKAINATLHFQSESFVKEWLHYLSEAKQKHLALIIQKHLVQLQFPIRQGISKETAYQATTRRGLKNAVQHFTNLPFLDNLVCFVHQSGAGQIPVLLPSNRAGFIHLVQAFVYKNEPVSIPDSMGACMVAGYNNWSRIWAYRAEWEAEHPDACSEAEWQAEFRRLIPHKHLYQDRFLILSDGPYSGVSAEEMGLDTDAWRKMSLTIRLEHECAHYLTKRVFGVMRRHLFDELLADFAGITAVSPFRPDWFLRFMGLENYPAYRQGGRLQNYLDAKPGSALFTAVQSHLKDAAENLAHFDQQAGSTHRTVQGKTNMLLAITRFSLADLAKPDVPQRLCESLYQIEKLRGEK